MRKTFSIFCGCLLNGYCFSQSPVAADSLPNAPVGMNVTVKAAETALNPDLRIYPNPAKNKITIEVKDFKPGMASVRILDIKGKLLREDSRLLTNGTEDIVMFLMLKPGIYFIVVAEPGKAVRKKLVIF